MGIKKHDLGKIGEVPTLQPKKIDGEWRFPLDTPIPDKYMKCPRCNGKAKSIGKKSPDGKEIFKCDACKIEFYEGKKRKTAWCKRHQKVVTGRECRGCRQFKLFAAEWKKDDRMCPDFVLIDNIPEGFKKE